ncbi:MAG: radical SAM protein [Pseudomonadota bacterium]
MDFVAYSEAFVPHFHIPLQSGSNEILKRMRRRYLRELYVDRVSRIKAVMPDACIGVDVIIGFPGETEAHFLETYNFLNNTLDFDGGVHTFAAGASLSGPVKLLSGSWSIPTGTMSFDGTLGWSAGPSSIDGAGTLAVLAGGVVNMTGSSTLALNALVSNAGTWSYGTSNNALTTNAGMTFTNLSGGIFSFDNDISINSTGGLFINQAGGVFRKTAGSLGSTISTAFDNQSGTIDSQTGGLVALDGGGTHTGFLLLGNGVEFSAGTHSVSNAGLASGALTISGGSVTLNGAQNLTNMTLTGGTLSTLGTTNITAALAISNGPITLNGGGVLQVGTLATANLTGATTFGVDGGTTLRNLGTFNYNSSNNALTLNNASSFDNQGLFVFQNALAINNGAGTNSTFVNQGGSAIVRMSAAGTSMIPLSFLNTGGAVEVPNGVLSLTGGGTYSGAFAVSGINTLDFDGGIHQFNAASTLSGPVRLLSGSWSIPSGTMAFSGDLGWTGGPSSINGPGTLQVLAGSNVNMTGSSTLSLTGIQITNAGTWSYATANNALTTGAGTTFTNNSGGIFSFDSDINVNSTGGLFVNQAGGIFRKTAGALGSAIATAFNNQDGTIDSQTAGLIKLNGGGAHTGFALLGNGVEISGGAHTVSGGGFTVGSLTVSGGTADLSGFQALNNLTMTGGTLSLLGNTSVDGTLAWSGGPASIDGPGTLTILSTGVVNVTGSSTLSSNGLTIENSGTWNYNPSNNALTLNTSTFNNNAGGVFDFVGNLAVNGGATFNNFGLLKGTGQWTGDVNNNSGGQISPGASIGTLFVQGNVLFDAGSDLLIELGSGLTRDKVDVFGSVTVATGATLTVQGDGGYAGVNGDNFLNVVDITSGTLSGTFNLAPSALAANPIYSSAAMNIIIGTTNTWLPSGPGTFIFGNAANWSLGTPTSAQDLQINGLSSGAIVDVISGITVNSLDLSGSAGSILKISSTGGLVINSFGLFEDFLLDGGQLSGPGTVSVAGNSSLDSGVVASTLALLGNLNVGGNVSVIGDITLAGSLNIDSSQTLTNTGVFSWFGSGLTASSGTFDNQGTLLVAANSSVGFGLENNGGDVFVSPGADVSFVQSIENNNGLLYVAPGATMATDSDFLQTGAAQTGIDGTLEIDGDVFLTDGEFVGDGLINFTGGGTFYNDGVVSAGASPGLLQILGDYVQGPTGIMIVDLDGFTAGLDFDLIQISGTAQLAGGIVINPISGFAPEEFDDFQFLETGLGILSGFDSIAFTGEQSFALISDGFDMRAIAGAPAIQIFAQAPPEILELPDPTDDVLVIGDPEYDGDIDTDYFEVDDDEFFGDEDDESEGEDLLSLIEDTDDEGGLGFQSDEDEGGEGVLPELCTP